MSYCQPVDFRHRQGTEQNGLLLLCDCYWLTGEGMLSEEDTVVCVVVEAVPLIEIVCQWFTFQHVAFLCIEVDN